MRRKSRILCVRTVFARAQKKEETPKYFLVFSMQAGVCYIIETEDWYEREKLYNGICTDRRACLFVSSCGVRRTGKRRNGKQRRQRQRTAADYGKNTIEGLVFTLNQDGESYCVNGSTLTIGEDAITVPKRIGKSQLPPWATARLPAIK